MKNFLILSLLVLSLIFCQEYARADEITYGGKIGIAVSNVTNTPESWESAKSSRTGFSGGVFLNYAFNDNLSVQPELLFAMKGFNARLIDGSFPVDLAIKLNYVELPVLAKYSFKGGERFKPWIYAGPCVSYSMSSTLELDIAGFFQTDIDFSDLTHITDFSFIAGAGTGIVLGSGMLSFDVAFQRGFTNVILSGDFMINGSSQTIDEDDAKNYGFTFMAGYSF